MKKVSELGLEAIQLEDQVLLVDNKSEILVNDWYFWDGNKNNNPSLCTDIYNEESIVESRGFTKFYKVIASTKPLEGLPLLVIEDEVEKITKNEVPDRIYKSGVNYAANEQLGFKKGYNKARQTCKFTEEDLMKCLKVVYDDWLEDKGHPERTEKEYFERIIQSLTKKELWIDAYWDCCGRCIDGEDKCSGTWELNIENNQIKAVWK